MPRCSQAAWQVRAEGRRRWQQAARAAPRPSHPPRAPDLLLDGLAANFSEGYAAGLPLLRRALSAFDRETSAEEDLRWLWLACIAAVHLWDYDRWDTFSSRHVRLTREAGALSELPLALIQRAYVLLFAGELAAAASLVEEVQVVTEATGSRLAPYGDLGLAALRGREAEMSTWPPPPRTKLSNVARVSGSASPIGRPPCSTTVLVTIRTRWQQPKRPANTSLDVSVTVNWGLVELVEAAARCGLPERATDAVRRLSESTSASGSDWALGVEARSRALLSEGETADRLYREAIERLGRTRMGAELARAHLVYGEWLRRENRRIDAREQLRAAHEMLTAMGMEGFADRARRELLATGETVRKRTVRHAHRSHGPGGPDRQAGPGRAHQPGDRQPAVHQPPHRRVAPGQRLHQVGHHLTQGPPLTLSPGPLRTSRAVVYSQQRLPEHWG